MRFRPFFLLLLSLAGLIFSSCEPETDKAPTLRVQLKSISGNNQGAGPGQSLSGPLVVRAIDEQGTPKQNIRVQFFVLAGGGTLTSAEVLTDQAGYAQTTWTLGLEGDQTVIAEIIPSIMAPGVIGPRIRFDATFSTATIQKISGDNQAWFLDTGLPEPLVIRLLDSQGNPAVNKPVQFTVLEGGGTITYFQPLTNSDGIASAVWRLGNVPTIQSVLVSIPSADGTPSATATFTAGFKAVPYGNHQWQNNTALRSPAGICFGPQGDLYVAEFANHKVVKWAPGGEGITVAGGNDWSNPANSLRYPHAVAVAPNGVVYVADTENDRIQKWLPGASTGITVAGINGRGPGLDQLDRPVDIQVDAFENMYILDRENHRVVKWAPGATAGITVAGGNGPGDAANQLNSPQGLFVDAAGTLFISDSHNSRIQKCPPGATSGITLAAGAGGPGLTELGYPRGLCVDASGNLFVADNHHNKVLKFSPGATAGVVVAGGTYGISPNSTFEGPADVILDAAGNIYVADQGNDRIMKWIP